MYFRNFIGRFFFLLFFGCIFKESGWKRGVGKFIGVVGFILVENRFFIGLFCYFLI